MAKSNVRPGTVVDGVIADWHAAFFNEEDPPGAKTAPSGRKIQLRRPRRPNAIGRARAQLNGLARRSPQVIVKITGVDKTMRKVRDHLDYVTRDGKLEITDQDGERTTGRADLRDIVDQWQHAGGRVANDGTRREAFHVIFSMPAGTDPEAVLGAVRELAADEFAGHQYVYVLHTFDTDPDPQPSPNPHVHVVVKASRADGTRLNPRKADLQRWRETFAERLRDRGIDATATSRAQRLRHEKADSQGLHHLKKTGTPSRKAPPFDQPPPQPRGMTPGRARILRHYQTLVDGLLQGSDADRGLAKSLVERLDDITRSLGLQRDSAAPVRETANTPRDRGDATDYRTDRR